MSTRSVHFIRGDALQLPFRDGSFDIVTVGYGLRNLADWERGLSEMSRLARPGGRLLVLDFGKPDSAAWRGIYFGYLRLFVPCLGLLFCGSWDHAKGIAYLVRTFERLHERRRALHLTILGPGVDPSVVMSAFTSKVRPFVHVIPHAAEQRVVDAYRAHDVLLWLSSYEGFGLVLLEAMSQGLAIVATPVGCVPSLVRDGENGLVIPKRDSDAAVSAVERLMDAPDLRRSLGAAARCAVSGMTWAQTARTTLDVYARARAERAA